MEWEYQVVSSVAEALYILGKYGGEARVIAGGTDLLLDLQEKKKRTSCLVDITRIPELGAISLQENLLSIGAAVTHTQAAKAGLLREKAAALAEAAASVGSPQIRNMATVAGNVLNAQPAADAAVALMALEARVLVADVNGLQEKTLQQCYLEVGKTAIDSTRQVLTAVSFAPLGVHQGSAFVRFAYRKSLALPVLNAAAVVTVENEVITRARIVLAPAGPMPFRARGAENFLQNKVAAGEILLEAARIAAAEAPFRDSPLRGSQEYRNHLAEVLVREALEKAVGRALKNNPNLH